MYMIYVYENITFYGLCFTLNLLVVVTTYFNICHYFNKDFEKKYEIPIMSDTDIPFFKEFKGE